MEKKRLATRVVQCAIGCWDKAKTAAFYSALFDWKIRQNGPAADIDAGSGIDELGGKTVVPDRKSVAEGKSLGLRCRRQHGRNIAEVALRPAPRRATAGIRRPA